MTAAIDLENVSKYFGKFPAVDSLSLSVPQGVVYGLLGPNGAGKTTTIRMIMNITAADSGEIRVLGSPMTREMQNRIGYLPEERGLYRKMKVLDHLFFLAAIKEVPRETARQRIAEWAGRLELKPWLKKKVDELSKGMQQKVQFIATVVHDPEILILDEPFSGLDPINTAIIKDYLSEFRKKGKTIVFSTHVLEQAEKLCDEICLLARSKKVLEGNLRDLKRRFSKDLLHLLVECGPEEIVALPGVVSSQAVNGGYVVALAPGTDQREFLRRTMDRHPLRGFSAKEPELEEIYLDAIRAAGIEETRTIE
ncbi:MAG TPA: ATP-binding cassette domain-containing protein [Thermoanaerobaculia bacterium]|jgi:ABC-2 type transport system ATP-binding protein|nr:ATP-binding cassette domain-containing protein [Thermoanaerobaculia bacterium]